MVSLPDQLVSEHFTTKLCFALDLIILQPATNRAQISRVHKWAVQCPDTAVQCPDTAADPVKVNCQMNWQF